MPAYPYALTLTNPGAESGTTGWTLINGVGTIASSATTPATSPPRSGARVFTSGRVPESWYGQTVALPSEVHDDVDAGLLEVTATSWHRCYSIQTDHGVLLVECFDGDGQFLSIGISPEDGGGTAWLELSASCLVPAGTRSIRLSTRNQRDEGINLDSSWDDFTLSLAASALEPRTWLGAEQDFDAADWTNVASVVSDTPAVWGDRVSWWQGQTSGNSSGFNCYRDLPIDSEHYASVDAYGLAVDLYGVVNAFNSAGLLDPSRLTLTFLDGSGNDLGSGLETSATPQYAAKCGEVRNMRGPVPAGTRMLRLSIIGGPSSGSHFDANWCRFHWALYGTGGQIVRFGAVGAAFGMATCALTVLSGGVAPLLLALAFEAAGLCAATPVRDPPFDCAPPQPTPWTRSAGPASAYARAAPLPADWNCGGAAPEVLVDRLADAAGDLLVYVNGDRIKLT